LWARLGDQSFQGDWNIFQRLKSWRWPQVGFYYLMRLWLSYM
jgi:hypothetical protein